LQKTQGSESHWDTSEVFRDIGIASNNMALETKDARKNELEESIMKLRLEMTEAISREDYERAAELRDILAPLVGVSRRKNDD
jgi:protein-arginine kinase activator protein McsA